MSRYRGSSSSNSDSKIYVGDLGYNTSKQDLEESFRHYGSLKSVWVARHPPGFAFVEFDDPRDAEDAVRGLDGRTVCGRRVRVELASGNRRRGGGGGGGGGRGPPRRGRPYQSDDKCYQCGERGHYARDCRRYDGRGRRNRSRSPRGRGRRSTSRSVSRSRSRSAKRSVDRSGSADRRSRSKGSSRSRSRSVDKKTNGTD